MNELVARLTNGLHPIVAERSASAQELREQIERGFVLLKFPNTRGGTELGSRLDMEQTRLEGADFEAATGSVHLVGSLTLNYDKVQLVADIELASLKGTGQLVLIEEAGGSQQARAGSSTADDPDLSSAKGQVVGNGGAASAPRSDSQEAGKAAGVKATAARKKRKANGARVA